MIKIHKIGNRWKWEGFYLDISVPLYNLDGFHYLYMWFNLVLLDYSTSQDQFYEGIGTAVHDGDFRRIYLNIQIIDMKTGDCSKQVLNGLDTRSVQT